MLSAVDGAKCIISYSDREYGYQVTPLKLQKLLYYLQAWSLVFNDEPLFENALEAWIHGPVVPSVYRAYKHLGASRIQDNGSKPTLEERQENVLQAVLSTYGSRDGRFLENLTHSEDPWVKARLGLAATDKSSRKISLQDMKNFYTPFVLSKLPPTISPKAVEIKGDSTRKKKSRPFIRGIGSVVDIYPTKSRKIFYTQSDFQGASSDFEEIASDWENIGGSIQSVIDNLGS